MIDKGACVSDCGLGRIAGANGKCEECDGPCPRCESQYTCINNWHNISVNNLVIIRIQGFNSSMVLFQMHCVKIL